MLPDILQDNLDVVFVGTAAGIVSARAGIYYANQQNKFWPTLEAVALIPKGFDRSDFAQAPEFGIGFTDLCKTRAGMDHTLARGDFDVAGLEQKLRKVMPRAVAFTSKKGASTFLGCRSTELELGVPLSYAADFPPVFALPSPSGAATGHWDIAPWRKLADWLKLSSPGSRARSRGQSWRAAGRS
jgi:TDG/mug DNA glycosylase family protein